tara:strand:- start:560 stop:862 length:303 start_codon:yes stop_codon:yes gene_type:complete
MRDLSKPLAPTYGDPKPKAAPKKMKKKPTPSQNALRAATSRNPKVYNAYGREVTYQTHMKGKKKQDGYFDASKKKQSHRDAIGGNQKRTARISGGRTITY